MAAKKVKKVSVDRQALLGQMMAQFEQVKAKTAAKHDWFAKTDEKIDNSSQVDSSEDLVRSNLTQTHLDQRDSELYDETPQIVPKARTFADKDLAEDIRASMKVDYDEMQFDQIKRDAIPDFNRYGVAVIFNRGYDKRRKVIKPFVINPRSIYPDNEYQRYGRDRFLYVMVSYTKMDLMAMGVSMASLKNIAVASDAEDDDVRTPSAQTRGISNEEVLTDGNPSFNMLQGYTWYNNKYYSVLCDRGFTTIVTLEEQEPVTTEEKEDPSLIPPDYTVIRRAKRVGDWFGSNHVERLMDKQNAENEIMNIYFKSMKKSLDNEPLFYDPNKIYGKIEDAITLASTGQIAIPANMSEGIGSVVAEIKKERVPQEVGMFLDRLNSQTETGTGMSATGLGVQGKVSASATQKKDERGSKEKRLGLDKKAFVAGLEDFRWNVWRRSHIKYMEAKDSNDFEIETMTGTKAISLNRDDYDKIKDLRFSLVSRDEVDALEEKEALGMDMIAEQVLQNPNTSEFAKVVFLRGWYESKGIPPEKARLLAGSTHEIEQAEFDVANNLALGIPVEIKSPDEDHQTYLEIYKSAPDMVYKKGSATELVPNEAKYDAITARKDAMLKKAEQQNEAKAQAATTDAQATGPMNGAASQQMNNAFQSQEAQTASPILPQ